MNRRAAAADANCQHSPIQTPGREANPTRIPCPATQPLQTPPLFSPTKTGPISRQFNLRPASPVTLE